MALGKLTEHQQDILMCAVMLIFEHGNTKERRLTRMLLNELRQSRVKILRPAKTCIVREMPLTSEDIALIRRGREILQAESVAARKKKRREEND